MNSRITEVELSGAFTPLNWRIARVLGGRDMRAVELVIGWSPTRDSPQSFHFSCTAGTRSGDEGATALAEVLRANTSITCVDMSGQWGAHRCCNGGPRGWLGVPVRPPRSIAGNRIGEPGAAQFAEALIINTTLTSLNLSGTCVCAYICVFVLVRGCVCENV